MNRAGQETFIMNVFRAIDRTQTAFNFLCDNPEKGDFDDEIRALGGKVFTLPMPRKRARLLYYYRYYRALVTWFKTHRDEYDAVHVHTHHNLDVLIHLKAAKRAKVKMIIHSHNTNAVHPKLSVFLRPFCNRYKATRFACSKEAGEWLFGKKAVEKGKVTVVYNGINVPDFEYDAEARRLYREELGLQDETVWGHVGRFNVQKNHQFLLRAFHEYGKLNPKSRLLLVGCGELEGEIRAQIKRLSLEGRVMLLGIRGDVNKLLNAFDYFVFPSLFEGLPVVAVEGEMNGLPFFMSDNITDEAVISENVRKLPIDDPKRWAEEIYKTAPERTVNLDYDRFDIRNTVNVLERKYRELC